MSKKHALAIGCALALCVTLGVAGCAPQQAQTSALPDTSAGVVQEESETGAQIDMAGWSMDLDCATCHSEERESAEASDCLASIHASSDCSSCHSNEDSLVATHQAAKSADASKVKRLKEPVSEEACFVCHGSWDELAEKTSSSEALKDKAGRVVNPHNVPMPEGHTFELTCTTCHTVHEAGDEPGAYCKTCHHEDLFECGTCH